MKFQKDEKLKLHMLKDLSENVGFLTENIAAQGG